MQKYCMKCMGLMPEEQNICDNCRHDNTKQNPFPALSAGEVLLERYLVGCVLKENSEGFTYIAFDGKNNRVIYLTEFFPYGICSRDNDNKTVKVSDEKRNIFSVLYRQFASLNEKLATLGSASSVLRCYKVIECNGTLYSCIQTVKAVTLQEFLRQNFGEINWRKAEEMFTPLIYGLNTINSLGITHKGICLENIVIENDKILKLTGFSIDFNRVKNNTLEPELYDGYSAIEQYYEGAACGEYTDVYSFCAVLFRVLTGVNPLSAVERVKGEVLVHPCKINTEIPIEVGDAIMKGLIINAKDRTQTFKELMKELYSAPIPKARTMEHEISQIPRERDNVEIYRQTVKVPIQENTAVDKKGNNNTVAFVIDRSPSTQLDKIGRTQSLDKSQRVSNTRTNSKGSNMKKKNNKSNKNKKGKGNKKEMSLLLKVLLISLPIMLGVFIILYYAVLGGNNKNKHESTTSQDSSISQDGSVDEDSSNSDSSSSEISSSESSSSSKESSSEESSSKVEDLLVVESLEGLVFEDIARMQLYKDNYTFIPTYDYDEFTDKGSIVSQSIKAGETMKKGGDIKIVVSKGARYYTIPPIVDDAGVYVNANQYALMLKENDVAFEIVDEATNDVPAGEIVKLNYPTGSRIDKKINEVVLIYVAVPDTSLPSEDVYDVLDE